MKYKMKLGECKWGGKKILKLEIRYKMTIEIKKYNRIGAKMKCAL